MNGDDFEPSGSSFPERGFSSFPVETGAGFGDPPAPGPEPKGAWYAPLTVLSFLTAAGVSFLMAALTRDVHRSAALIGLTFCAPVLLVLITALVLEHYASAMNPKYSRRAQALVALVAVLAAFVTGCFGEFTGTVSTTVRTDYVILLDKSSSMDGFKNDESTAAVRRLLNGMDDGTSVGLVTFGTDVEDFASVAPLDQAHRAEIDRLLNTGCNSTTNFYYALTKALELADGAGNPTRVLVISDGHDEPGLSPQSLQDETLKKALIADYTAGNITVSCVEIKESVDAGLAEVIAGTGGKATSVASAGQLLAGIDQIGLVQEDTDVLRAVPRTGRVVTASLVLFLLTGLLEGAALTLMLSRKGQRRFQLALSPLMGLAAFALCNYGAGLLPDPVLREGLLFSLYGVVFMRRNTQRFSAPVSGGTAGEGGGFDSFP